MGELLLVDHQVRGHVLIEAIDGLAELLLGGWLDVDLGWGLVLRVVGHGASSCCWWWTCTQLMELPP